MSAKAIGGPAVSTEQLPFTLELRGRYTLADVPRLWHEVQSATERLGKGDCIRIDLSAAERLDGSAIVVLERARQELEQRGVKFTISAPARSVEELMDIYAGTAKPGGADEARAREGLLARLGRATAALAGEIWASVAFVGRVLGSLPAIVRSPRSVNWRDVPLQAERAGADAVPIVAVIDFLIGVVTAYESTIQLKRFGATLYVADLVGLSIVRELGPLITAVIVTGRTGAAFAAELGTMSVSEDVDALRAMRIDPIRFLVIPRIVALALVVPILTMLGDCVGLLGGLLVAHAAIGISGPEYLAETMTAVFASDVFWGALKGFTFALAIAFIGCQQGLAASGGASGVGRRTTSAVVASLFALIVIDALFVPTFKEHYR